MRKLCSPGHPEWRPGQGDGPPDSRWLLPDRSGERPGWSGSFAGTSGFNSRLSRELRRLIRVRHGLDSVAGSGTLHAETGSEIRELQSAVAECNANYNNLIQNAENPPLERAEDILSELRGALAFLLEDGNHSQGDEQLSNLREVHNDPDSMEGLAMALEGYAELAELYKVELSKLPRFPLEIIDESLQVARDLRMRSVERQSGELVKKQRELIALRNRLIFAMMDRVSKVRRAVRYVFSDNPELVRLAYSRARRKAARDKAPELDAELTGHEPTMEVPIPATP